LIDLVLYAVPIEAFFYIAAFFMMKRYRITRRQHGENVEKVSSI